MRNEHNLQGDRSLSLRKNIPATRTGQGQERLSHEVMGLLEQEKSCTCNIARRCVTLQPSEFKLQKPTLVAKPTENTRGFLLFVRLNEREFSFSQKAQPEHQLSGELARICGHGADLDHNMQENTQDCLGLTNSVAHGNN